MERLLDFYRSLSSRVVTYGFDRYQSKTTISTAFALITLCMIYRSIQPPARLRHIPHIGFFTYLGAVLKGKSLNHIARNVVLPTAMEAEGGIYTRFDQNGWSVHITGPKAAKTFLLKTDIFRKDNVGSSRGETLLGRFAFKRNIVVLNGVEWKAQRQVANPAFKRSMPTELFGTLCQKSLKQMADEMDDNGILDFHYMAERFTLDVIGLAGFGFDFHAIDDPQCEWVTRYSQIMTETMNPWFSIFHSFDQKYRFLFPSRVQIHREMDVMLHMMDEIIVSKRQALKNQQSKVPESERDLLTLMIEAESSGEGTMTNDDLRNNLCIFFLAGHDTTANALAYAAYYLAANPDVQHKAREEALRVLGDAHQDVFPTLNQTRELPYINMIIKETLRMNPPINQPISRVNNADTEIAGTFIPKGTRTTVDIYHMHHNPIVWNDPEAFRPERFAAGGEAEAHAGSGLSWIPFSNGERQCIGMNFSLIEQRVFLSMLLRKYEWHLPEDSIHKDGLRTIGLVGLVKPKDLLLSFKKRY